MFLYTVVVPDTYRFTQEYTVWPYNALSQGDGADKLQSIWYPNVPHDSLALLQYLSGISCSWFGQGSCTASRLRFHIQHAHVTKINTEIKADVTLGRCQENGSRSVEVLHELVKCGILSELCLLTAEIALQRLSFFLENRAPRGGFLRVHEFPLLPIWRELDMTCNSLKNKEDVVLDVNADHDQNATSLNGCWKHF